MCAVTICSLGSLTLKVAFGRTSTTVPSNSITSSFGRKISPFLNRHIRASVFRSCVFPVLCERCPQHPVCTAPVFKGCPDGCTVGAVQKCGVHMLLFLGAADPSSSAVREEKLCVIGHPDHNIQPSRIPPGFGPNDRTDHGSGGHGFYSRLPTPLSAGQRRCP